MLLKGFLQSKLIFRLRSNVERALVYNLSRQTYGKNKLQQELKLPLLLTGLWRDSIHLKNAPMNDQFLWLS